MPVKREKMFTTINKDIIVMSQVVFKQMQYIKELINASEVSTSEIEFFNNELVLDSFEVKMRRNIINSMVLYGPRTSDMRRLMACYDITLNMERVGDLLVNIHKELKRVNLDGALYQAVVTKLRDLEDIAERMLTNAIKSYSSEDVNLTRSTIEMDDFADEIHVSIEDDIVEFRKNTSMQESEVLEIIALSSISHNLERIADYSTNIVESSFYLVKGSNIQHVDIDEVLNQ
ncbi:MAG: PhoU domain-containing protein [Rikenellaceae bacterium]